MNLVVPAVLPTSREDLLEKLALLSPLSRVSRIQIDVVDGVFATPASWPYSAPLEFERMVKRGDELPNFDRIAYEIDLMCRDTDRAASAWIELGARRLVFHAESIPNLAQHLKAARVRYAGDIGSAELVSFGVALNVESDLALLEPCLDCVEFVQFMGIATIGRQGQPFDERVIPKVRVFHEKHPQIPIQVDGGVSLVTAKKLLGAGVSNLVVGSGILKASDPEAALAQFEALRSIGTV
ncbi:MAG TPA: hypothetical protein VFP46_01300 [Candidatus Paceibacterota bacterium]|nr:hypothetical protein [Candidatus Paceibacterota bacterium]